MDPPALDLGPGAARLAEGKRGGKKPGKLKKGASRARGHAPVNQRGAAPCLFFFTVESLSDNAIIKDVFKRSN